MEMEQIETRAAKAIAELKAQDHHTRCRDCGVFVEKARWVWKGSLNAIQHQRRPLCGPCRSEYD